MRVVRIVCAAAFAVAALGASPALAATRYAAPGRSDVASCALGDPCSLKHAVEGAGDNDEVIVEPGRYAQTGNIFTDSDVNVHGVLGQPKPVVVTDGTFVLASGQSSLSDIEIRSTASSFGDVQVSGTSVERVIVRAAPASGSSATACLFDGPVTIRDVVCWVKADVGSPIALDTGNASTTRTSTLRNVTAVTVGPATGSGVVAAASGGATHTLNVTNSIARGTSHDISVTATSGSTMNGYISHTNYSAIFGFGPTDDGTRQNTAPAFVDAANGNLHQANGSATIDAGVNSAANGIADADGVWRTVNGVVDIGGYERTLPPTATTTAATAPTLTGATLNGTVNPNGAVTSYHFEYGKTTAYGTKTVPVSVGSSGDPQAANAVITTLKPDRTYHYRVVAVSALGTAPGADMTFKTKHDAFGGVSFSPHAHERVRKGKAKVRLFCTTTTIGKCTGRLVLSVRIKGKKHVLGSAKFSIKPGKGNFVKVRISAFGLSLIQKHRVRTRGTATAHDKFGTPRTTKRPVDLSLVGGP